VHQQELLRRDETVAVGVGQREHRLDRRAEDRLETVAVALTKGQGPTAPVKVNNGTADIPAFLLDPIPVTKDKVKDTIVKDGFYPAADICTAEVKDACAKAGIQ
jgi:D-xylose transport system substrate-binding protein